MLQAVLLLLKIGFVFSLISLLAGLVKPVYVLWFLDRMNRLKVIKFYGFGCVLTLVLIYLLSVL
ncbi:hypothetical protein [Algoriphagus halophytocola]|uniref:Uncharacterized protein n=1 Tax=Algoriphagus halophytocola TaxID=2991499 RepID=A0ABY6MHV6_9BACT|nr:hypothetical protein [Algoriphagus sp. TR-M5]UZD21881.1 hypothetical protein OM944_14535 [Algoriphagus sp. TR-M5]